MWSHGLPIQTLVSVRLLPSCQNTPQLSLSLSVCVSVCVCVNACECAGVEMPEGLYNILQCVKMLAGLPFERKHDCVVLKVQIL